MRTTLTLDDDVYQSVLTMAKVSGDSLGRVASRLIRRALSAPATAGDYPTFNVPHGTPIIPGNRAIELLDEED